MGSPWKTYGKFIWPKKPWKTHGRFMGYFCKGRYKPEVETVPQTGSINDETTETDIDAISVDSLYLCFTGKFSIGAHANLTRRFLHPEIPRWRTNTGSSYNFAMENDIKVISAAAVMF